MFTEGILDPNLVKYSIVTEQGASIYSCGDIAKKEFPDLDVNLISAGKYIYIYRIIKALKHILMYI